MLVCVLLVVLGGTLLMVAASQLYRETKYYDSPQPHLMAASD